MIASLRPLALFALACLLTACATPRSPLGELPRIPQASVEQMLQQATAADAEEAASLRLAAAEQAARDGNRDRARDILAQVDLNTLKPAEQVFGATLAAELALAAHDAKAALSALQVPGMSFLEQLPVEQQIRTSLARAAALEADGQTLAAARERVFIAPLLPQPQATANHEAIWSLVSNLPADQAQAGASDPELAGWLALAQAARTPGTLAQQKESIQNWQRANPQHPAALQLPKPLQTLMALADRPLEQVALLLPQSGPLSNVARALRDGFLAAHFQAAAQGQAPHIRLYDSSQIRDMQAFYAQAKADGMQLVIGPLEKSLVKQLADLPQQPLTTLALNYSDADQQAPSQLFQFGLAAEDEARTVAERAWNDGKRKAVALVPPGEWGDRVLVAFRDAWQARGGSLVDARRIAEPVELSNQISSLFGSSAEGAGQRRDVDFLFLAATPLQAQQIRPIMVYQYIGDIPVYATSNLYSASGNRAQYLDLEGIRFCDAPWLLQDSPLRQQVTAQWPQAASSLGRLYAMGADAYLLFPRLAQLEALPGTRLEGQSGSLQLNAQHRVERQLPWAQFRDGRIVELPAETLSLQ